MATTTTRARAAQRGRRVAAAVRDSDRIAALHEQLTERVAGLVHGQQWQAMLTAAARFHDYSLHNLLLIVMQRPDATRVAGYRTWQRVGRQVRKGERGIAIFAPLRYRIDQPDDDQSTPSASTGERPDATPPRRRLRGFRIAYVFDVSQTDGDPIPDVPPLLLDGADPGRLWDALAAQIRDAGYALNRGDCGHANGWANFATREVRVRADLSAAQACKTLAHELAHVLLHAEGTTPRERGEVEAESVAYIVCHASGLPSDDYSLPYVAQWAAGDLDVLAASARAVTTTARAVLDRIAATTGTPTDPLTAQATP
ncbi:MAG TPA: ArdC-like ssDNA-binding domain-containing protein [Mycobacteriales bacterium]|nr:ArdC-like ssDNA-binding domain-containing protein [Mycobacteriales bacterium]